MARDPLIVGVERDVCSQDANGLLIWFDQYYGLSGSPPFPLFTHTDAADPFDLMLACSRFFEPPAREIVRGAAAQAVDRLVRRGGPAAPLEFFIAARLAEIADAAHADVSQTWQSLGEVLDDWNLASGKSGGVAIREAFESIFRAVHARLDDAFLVGRSDVSSAIAC